MAGWQFWIDRGGTFTDIVARHPDGALTTHKLLSENPERYRDAAVAGIRQAMGLSPTAALPPGLIETVKMGTTVATNALLERKGARTLLLVDEGYGDVLTIATQARPRLFDLDIRLPAPLFDAVAEVGGRVAVDGTPLTPLDEDAVAALLARHKQAGMEAVAIALVHAWRHPAGERALKRLALAAGFTQVSCSHEVSPLLGLVARGRTTVVDAYLSPVLRRYVDQVAGELRDTPLYFMQSNGGLADKAAFQGKDAILSGPAGGVVGAVRTALAAGFPQVIGFDMGGTSTDVALYAGRFERAFDTRVAGVDMRVPMMAISTVAAGGGSLLHFDGARFHVGPDSAGANPGPACYRRGGPLTVTDANVLLGKIQPRHFPALFGPNGDQPLDADVVRERFDALAVEVSAATGRAHTPHQVAEGFLRVAVANMAAAIKKVALEKGHAAADFTLQCFGGAGGQHACRVADELGMRTVFIHPLAGVLSAYGMGLADQTAMRQQAVERPLDAAAVAHAHELAAALGREAVLDLGAAGAPPSLTTTLTVRYQGTDTALPLTLPLPVTEQPGATDPVAPLRHAFEQAHQARFGFIDPERALIVDSVVVEAVRAGPAPALPDLPARGDGSAPVPIDQTRIGADAAPPPAPIYRRADLLGGDTVAGPALIIDAIATTVVEDGWQARVDRGGGLVLTRTHDAPENIPGEDDTAVDPVRLELFNTLFMGIAEQMGVVLRNTATSVNIKERLDFSCALFDQHGDLVANAPHVPVHLGAMSESVRTVMASRGASLRPGDAVVLNNPFNGGTHLPDVTVISPVFDETGTRIRFFLANRGHHADIGGITPGSTPPFSRTLADEGVVIDDFLLVRDGRLREDAFRALLTGGPHPARNPDVNIADIKAQLAANAAGAREVAALVRRHGWPVVDAYTRHVMANAQESVRRAITRLRDGRFTYTMDNGDALVVSIRVDQQRREAVIDFTGTGPQRTDNFNAPPAVTRSSVLYAFRCLVGDDMPLNEGCLAPLRIVLPPGSFLSPRPGCAVVAGNTEVSQAVCNALLGAMGVVASAQGTMNNFLFGNARHQYYETICGGAGAGPDFDGASAVHTHMTNTRITDPEVLELRYPVRLTRFAIRRGSGGAGRHRGGDGVVRTIQALEPLTATLVASRRTVAPFGLAGGADGAPGRQWVVRADGSRQDLDGIAQVDLAAGDAITIETPGGGGFGAARPPLRS